MKVWQSLATLALDIDIFSRKSSPLSSITFLQRDRSLQSDKKNNNFILDWDASQSNKRASKILVFKQTLKIFRSNQPNSVQIVLQVFKIGITKCHLFMYSFNYSITFSVNLMSQSRGYFPKCSHHHGSVCPGNKYGTIVK